MSAIIAMSGSVYVFMSPRSLSSVLSGVVYLSSADRAALADGCELVGELSSHRDRRDVDSHRWNFLSIRPVRYSHDLQAWL